MKQFIWLLCGIFLSGLLLGALSSCGTDQYGVVFMTTGQPSVSGTHPGAAEGADGPASASEDGGAAPALSSGEEDRRLAYGKVLWDAYLKGVLPDGTELDRPSLLAPAEGNRFALWDVDGDGEEELLLYWVNASMAGMRGIVFGFRDGAVYEELSAFPALTFYEGGAVQADWSHNQGWGGRFWPYTVYQFQPETGVYAEAGAVDAWDRALTDGDHPGWFPEETDKDGDWLIYYLLSGEWTWGSRTAPDGSVYETWAVEAVDGDAYERWRDSLFDVDSAIRIPFQELTEETVAALGCPRPDVTYPEPVG